MRPMRIFFITSIVTVLCVTLSCDKDKVEAPLEMYGICGYEPCAPPVDSTFQTTELFNAPDSNNLNSNFRIRFLQNLAEFYDIAFVDEPVSGIYSLSDSLISSSYAEIHIFQSSAFRWTTINNGDVIHVTNTPTQIIFSFCNITMQEILDGSTFTGGSKTFIYNK